MLIAVTGDREERALAGWSHSGEVWTDGEGRAVVVLPPFVRTHRAGFDYQLTPIGSHSPALVAETIVDDRFTIATEGFAGKAFRFGIWA